MALPPTNDTLTDQARQRLAAVRAEIAAACRACGREPDSVRLVGVTKSATEAQIAALQRAGLVDLAENRVQQLLPRAESSHALATAENLPRPRWHMIGHLQTNKVKAAAPYVEMIHSIDSQHLAREIDKRAGQLLVPRVIQGLVEVNISREESKYGAKPEEVRALVESLQGLAHLQIVGLMTMAPYCPPEQVPELATPVFAGLRALRDEIRARLGLATFTELSMGMSGDFAAAITQGATMVRIGTRLFQDG